MFLVITKYCAYITVSNKVEERCCPLRGYLMCTLLARMPVTKMSSRWNSGVSRLALYSAAAVLRPIRYAVPATAEVRNMNVIIIDM